MTRPVNPGNSNSHHCTTVVVDDDGTDVEQTNGRDALTEKEQYAAVAGSAAVEMLEIAGEEDVDVVAAAVAAAVSKIRARPLLAVAAPLVAAAHGSKSQMLDDDSS